MKSALESDVRRTAMRRYSPYSGILVPRHILVMSRCCTSIFAQNYAYRIAPNLRGAKFARICNFLNFAETIFTDAVNVTLKVTGYT